MIGYLVPNYPLIAAFRTLPAVPPRTRARGASRLTQGIFKMAPNFPIFSMTTRSSPAKAIWTGRFPGSRWTAAA